MAKNIGAFESEWRALKESAGGSLTTKEKLTSAWEGLSEDGGIQYYTTGTTLTTGLGKAMTASSAITQSNAAGGSVTSLVNDRCFLIITRPQWSAPANYRKLFGYPSDCSGTINEKFHGFLSIRSIRLESVPGTPEEKSEIEQLMRAGVYVDNIFAPE